MKQFSGRSQVVVSIGELICLFCCSDPVSELFVGCQFRQIHHTTRDVFVVALQLDQPVLPALQNVSIVHEEMVIERRFQPFVNQFLQVCVQCINWNKRLLVICVLVWGQVLGDFESRSVMNHHSFQVQAELPKKQEELKNGILPMELKRTPIRQNFCFIIRYMPKHSVLCSIENVQFVDLVARSRFNHQFHAIWELFFKHMTFTSDGSKRCRVKNGLRDDDDDSLVIDWFSCGFVENEWSGSLTEASGETSLGPASSYDNLNSDRFGLGDLRASDGMGGREEVDLLNTSAGFIRVSGDPDRLFVGEPVGVPDTDI